MHPLRKLITDMRDTERQPFNSFLEYARGIIGLPKPVIVSLICSMSYFDVENGCDLINNMLKNRTIYLRAQFSIVYVNIVNALLLYYDCESSDEIKFYISSPGGDVYLGLGITDCMRFLRSDIRTCNYWYCAGFATVILASGTKGKRESVPLGKVFFHRMGIGDVTQVDAVKATDTRELDYVKEEVVGMLAEATGQPKEVIRNDIQSRIKYDANKAKEYGIIDIVLDEDL